MLLFDKGPLFFTVPCGKAKGKGPLFFTMGHVTVTIWGRIRLRIWLVMLSYVKLTKTGGSKT